MSKLKPYMTTGDGNVLYHETVVLAMQERIATLEALLRRYRNETPLGNQPHMIAHEVDELLGGGE